MTIELDSASATFRRAFNCNGAVPYYPAVGRVLLPTTWERPALVVPLDGHYVVETPVINRPVPWLAETFATSLPAFLDMLAIVKPHLDFADLPNSDVDGRTPYLPNGFFGPMDAASLTAMLATSNPRRYIEIGSGTSTRFARRAIERFALSTRITCIDPHPRQSIDLVADEIIPKSILDVDLAIFDALEAGDILFFDGSHLSFSGTDCPRFFLEVLPRLPARVLIHIHDIFLPNDYPDRLRTRFYNEQQLLAAFLFGNERFWVTFPVNYLHTLGHCPEGVSFWMRTV